MCKCDVATWLSVYINISIHYIDKVEETALTFSVKIHILLKWYDNRLTFYNLRGEMKRGNAVGLTEQTDLWIPQLVFTNSLPEIHINNDLYSFLMVKKEGLPMDEENHDLQDNEHYRGAENPFIYESFLDLNLRCNFKFTTYPFDQQTCSILVSMTFATPFV